MKSFPSQGPKGCHNDPNGISMFGERHDLISQEKSRVKNLRFSHMQIPLQFHFPSIFGGNRPPGHSLTVTSTWSTTTSSTSTLTASTTSNFTTTTGTTTSSTNTTMTMTSTTSMTTTGTCLDRCVKKVGDLIFSLNDKVGLNNRSNSSLKVYGFQNGNWIMLPKV